MLSRFQKVVVALICVSVFWPGPDTYAETNPANSSKKSIDVIEDYSVESIGSELTDLKMDWRPMSRDDGTLAVVADVFGVRVFLFPGNCREEPNFGCSDVYLISVIDDPKMPAEKLLDYNNSHPYVYVLAIEGGFIVQRYDFERAGEPVANFAASLMGFHRNVLNFTNTFGLTVDSGIGSPLSQSLPLPGSTFGNRSSIFPQWNALVDDPSN